MRTKKISIFLTALVLSIGSVGLLPAQTNAQPKLPVGVQQITSVEGITEYSLPNGLHVLLFPDQSMQTTTVNITYLVGSRNESYGESGIAHLLEHMAFKGTPSHRDIPKLLNERGAKFNASTSYDRTNYFEALPASDENLKWMLDFEADRPQWSPQNRPMRVTSKPANGRGRGLSCFTLQLPVQASLILYANSADRI
jgi:zinc protease